MDEFLGFLVAGLVIMGVLIVAFGTNFYEVISPSPPTTLLRYEEQNVAGGIPVGPENIVLTKFYDLGDINISHTKFDREFLAPSKHLFNGLLFGSNEIRFSFEAPEDMQSAMLHFEVEEANGYAPLEVIVNGEVVARKDYAAGAYDIPLDAQSSYDIKIQPLSSGWRIWAPAVYELARVKATTRSRALQSKVFNFELEKEEYENFFEGRITLELDKFAGKLNAFVNNKMVYDDEIIGSPKTLVFTNQMLVKKNVLELKATNNSIFAGTASLSILYSSKKEHYVEVPFNLTDKAYDKMGTGRIQFDVISIDKAGGISIRIVSSGVITFGKYGDVERKTYSYPITKQDVRAGQNALRIESVGDAVFNVKNVVLVI